MPNSLDQDLVLRLKNVDQVLRQLKGKIDASFKNVGNISISPQAAQQLTNLAKAIGRSQPAFKDAAASLNVFGHALQRVAVGLKGAAPILSSYSRFMNAATKAQHDFNKEQSRTSDFAGEFGRQTGIASRRFGGFLIAREIISQLGLAFKSATDQAIGFQREIIRLAQFQNTTIKQSEQLGDFVGKLAIKFGASSQSLVKSAQILAQAGRSTGEIQSILSALAPASLTASFKDLEGATESLNALLGQFDLRASDSTQVLDELNAVAEAFNVNIDELFEGLKKAGSTFSALAGVKEGITPGIQALREYAAIFTAVIDTSREGAATIGTALKTILPRLQRGETQSLLKSFGIDLLDNNKNFVGPLESIKRISEALKGLSSQSPAFTKVIEELGGGRQFNRALPLIQETAKIQRALDIAANASGSVAEDAALGQEAFQVQIDKTIERFRQLLRELSRSESFKALAGSLLGIANAAITLADSLKELLPLFASFAAFQAVSSIAPFAKNFSRGASFGLPRFNDGGLVPGLFTPGEKIFYPSAVRREGISKLRNYNATGNISGIKSLAGTYTVPGTGNGDTVRMSVPEGSFVIKKSSVEKSRKGYMYGGVVRKYAPGGTVGNPDPRFDALLNKNSKILGEQLTRDLLPKNVLQSFSSDMQKVAGSIKKSFGFFTGTQKVRGISGNNSFGISSNVPTAQVPVTFLHELVHALNLTTKNLNLPEQSKRIATDEIRRRAQDRGIPLNKIDFDREVAAYQLDLNQRNLRGFAGEQIIGQLAAITDPDKLKEAVKDVIEKSSREVEAKKVAGQFRGGSAQFASSYGQIHSDFRRQALYAGIRNPTAKADFAKIAKSSQDLATLKKRLDDQVSIVYQPADDGRDLGKLSREQDLRNKADIQRERIARKRAAKGQTLSADTLSRIDALSPATAQLTPSQQRRISLRVGASTYSVASGRVLEPDPQGRLRSLASRFNPQAIGASAKDFFRRPISESTFGRIQAGSFALGAAGGLLTTTATSGAGKGTGGALAGAAFGLQSSLLTANPVIIALSTLAGAATGASAAVTAFAKETEQAANAKVVDNFIAGKASVVDVGQKLKQFTAFDPSFKTFDTDQGIIGQSFLNTALRRGNAVREGDVAAFNRAGIFSQIGANLTLGYTAKGVVDKQQATELAEARSDFSQATERQLDLVRNEVISTLKKGGIVDQQAIVKKFTSNADSARVIALANPRLKDVTTLQNDENAKTLAALPIIDLVRETTAVNKPLEQFVSNLKQFTDVSVLLNSSLSKIQSSFFTLNEVVSQFDRDIESSFALAGGSNTFSSKLVSNVFANPAGASQDVFDEALFNLKNSLGLEASEGFSAAAGTASLANFAKTELPTLLNRASRTAKADDTISDFARGVFPNSGNGLVNKFLRSTIDTTFSDENDLPLQGLTENQIADASEKLAKEFGRFGPIIADLVDKLNANTQRQDQQAISVANANVGIARQQIGINQIGARRQVTAAEILGTRSPLANRAASQISLQNDVSAIFGSRNLLKINQIETRLGEINKQGVNRNNVNEFTKLTEALKLLSTDTRVLDSTMQRVNELNQAQQGSRNVVDRLLGGGPQEIIKFNQQLRDFTEIAQGGDIGGPRALEALNTMEQLLQSFTPEQFQSIVGISKDKAEENLRSIRGEQGNRILGGPVGEIIAGNVRGDGRQALVAEANNAFDIMQKASEVLKQQSQAQLMIAVEQMGAQQKLFTEGITAAFDNAFNAKGNLDLQQSLNNFTQAFGGDKASLELRGKTDVIVSFNGTNGVFKDIQKDLEGAISRIVNQQIKSALNANQGIQGANSP